jgi:hypothetical protein
MTRRTHATIITVTAAAATAEPSLIRLGMTYGSTAEERQLEVPVDARRT